jgi:MtN3 and saliva related transmembrane protein
VTAMTTLGLLAGALTTLSFLPQVIRTMRTGSARDLSWGWLVLFGTGVAGWLVYGAWTRDLAIAATNAVTITLVGALVVLKAWQQTTTRRAREKA